MRLTLFLCFILGFNISAQVVYEGTIGNNPVEVVLNIDSDYSDGVYLYKKLNIPIELKGSFKNGTLTVFESFNGKNSGKFVFKRFNKDEDVADGIWQNLQSKKVYPVSLTKKKEDDSGLLQVAHTAKFYFKVMQNEESTTLNIFDSKTNQLFQTFKDWCGNPNIYSITVDDYNFDGSDDFSGCVQSYAGPNTSSTYYLFDKKKNQFVESDFSGTSLEFDQIKKRIYETNQCCAGASIIKNVYNIKNNQMNLLEEHCYKRNEKSGIMVEKKPKDCY